MPFLIETVAGAITEFAVQTPVEGAWNKAQRNDRIIRILRKVGLDPDRPPDDQFETLYAYALVEWGAFKPAELLALFRDAQVRDAFERAMHANQPDLWRADIAEQVEGWREQGRFTLDYNPQRELEAFAGIFDRLVRYSRTPADVQRDHTLNEVRDTVAEMLLHLEQLQAPETEGEAEQLHAYLTTTMRQCSGVTLAPLDRAAKERRYLTLQRVFIHLDAGSGERDLAPGATMPSFSSVIAHAHANQRLILLGDPGSGKTTVLRFLGLCLAGLNLEPDGDWRDQLAWPVRDPGRTSAVTDSSDSDTEDRHPATAGWTGPAPVPVLVPLRHFARTQFDPGDPQAIWQYVCRSLEREELAEAIPALQRKAHWGELIFLFDGVDEVPPQQRADVWRAIASMNAGSCGGNRWLATCRILSYSEAELPESGIPVRTVQPLSRAQIAGFVAHWFESLTEAGELSTAVAEDKARQLLTATEREHLRELAENPMLLTIMALVQTYYGTLPQERARLYQACVETLLLRWQLHKEETENDLPDVLTQLGAKQDDLERLLWEVGWTAHERAVERREDADITEAEVLAIARKVLGSYANAERFVAYTEERAHLLIGRGGVAERVYGFPHRTFQEYFAACYLAADRRFGRKARELAAQGDTWREVLLLAVGTLVFNRSNREKALDAIQDVLPSDVPEGDDRAGWRRVWLAGEMLAEIGRGTAEQDEVGRELLPDVRAALAGLLEQSTLPVVQRAAAANALGKLGDTRPAVLDPDQMRFCLVPPGPFVMGSDDPELRITNEKWNEDTRPTRHENAVPYAYWMAEWPVTNAQYAAFVAGGGYGKAAYWREAAAANVWRDGVVHGWYWDGKEWQQGSGTAAYDYGDPFNLPNHPVVGVCWYEALAFCRWLTDRWQADGRLPADWQVTLPSEAEWEKAARGGSTLPQPAIVRDAAPGFLETAVARSEPNPLPERVFSWGDTPDPERANYRETGLGVTSALGVLRDNASPTGCRELSGNVYEWTRSIYGVWDFEKRAFSATFPYPYTADPERETLEGGIPAARVIRGGSWGANGTFVRCAFRGWNYPYNWLNDVGFRVVLSPSPSGL